MPISLRFILAWFFWGALLAAPVLTAQQAPTPAEPSAPAAAQFPEVRLEAHDGKTRFYLGDRIQLDLVFRNQTGLPYTLNTSLYGDLSEQVEIAPSSGWFEWRTQSGHDYSAVQPLKEAEVRIPVVLNQGFVFREPGQYAVKVKTARISSGSFPGKIKYLEKMETNSLGVTLEAMPAAIESERVKQLVAEIGAANSETRTGASRRNRALEALADLEGDEALRAKLALILDEDEPMRSLSGEAMAATRNLPLQLDLLEAAWRNPAQMPLWDVPGLIQETRLLMRGKNLQGWRMVAASPKAGDPEAQREAGERRDDMRALLDSLPQRKGENRAAALYYLFEFQGLGAEELARIRPTLIAEFGSLNDTEQGMLLGASWPRLRDPAMATPLRAILDKQPENRDALQRLIEIDPSGARSYVIRALCGAGWPVMLNQVAALPDDTLPEVDGCLGAKLATPPATPHDNQWSLRAALAARFATAQIMPQLRQGWKSPEQLRDVLPLLLRWAPDEAMRQIAAEPFDGNRLLNLFFSVNKVYEARHASFPPQLLAWLRKLVSEGGDIEAERAAYELSIGGLATDRAILEARLAQLHADWPARTSDPPPASNATAEAANPDALESELVWALRNGRFWTLTSEEAAQLAASCLSKNCRMHNPAPK